MFPAPWVLQMCDAYAVDPIGQTRANVRKRQAHYTGSGKEVRPSDASDGREEYSPPEVVAYGDLSDTTYGPTNNGYFDADQTTFYQPQSQPAS